LSDLRKKERRHSKSDFKRSNRQKKFKPSKYRKFLKNNNSSPKLTNTNTTFENLLSGKFGRRGACQKAYFSALETKPAM
jgi:hypothetical protein